MSVPENETKAERFKRIARPRVKKVQKAIQILLQALHGAVDRAMGKFDDPETQADFEWPED